MRVTSASYHAHHKVSKISSRRAPAPSAYAYVN